MKSLIYISLLSGLLFISCKKTIDLYPQSNLNTGTFYQNLDEVKAGLTGAYRGLIAPLSWEWMLTELRSDNSKQGVTGSTSATNRDFNELDMFFLNSTHPRVYDYWLDTYNNIRNANIIIQKLGVVYDPATGTNSFTNIEIPITAIDRKQLAGEALFIRAYHYYNLVRLFGGVFLIHQQIPPDDAKKLNRVSADEIYKIIQADLKTAADNMNTLTYAQVAGADRGRATGWAAKALLAKVYLSLNKKAEAITLLNDVRLNSGHSLVTAAGSAGSAYANVFSSNNEMSSEILFTVRFKALSGGLGNPFANRFAPLQSGTAVVVGDGQGLNYPTAELDSITKVGDDRKAVNVARFVSGANTRTYSRKFLIPPPTQSNEGESDWPVIRYADVLLMLAEAQGNSTTSIDYINMVRTRSKAPTIVAAGVNTVKMFEDTLSNERRIEFATENHRWFDLVRYGTTMTTINAVSAMQKHFAFEFVPHYGLYPLPQLTLGELQALVATPGRLLLPIPQREIDTNTQLVIPQNPSY